VRPRVALVATTTATEPAELLAARLRTLLDAGWDAWLLAKGPRWSALRDLAPRDRLHWFEGRRNRFLPPSSLLRRPRALVRYLAAEGQAGALDQPLLRLRPDLVHFHSGPAARKALRLKPLLGCRVVVSFREDGHDLQPPLEPIWEEADLVAFPDSARLLRAAAVGCPPEKAGVLPPPVSALPDVTGSPRSRNGRLRILSAGPLLWEQGFEHSLHAVRLLLDAGVDCEYRILGQGDHAIPIAFARHELGLADRVRMLTPDQTRLEQELREADVFLDPAVTDTLSASGPLSAEAAGVPLVATERAHLPGDGGIAVPRRDPRAMADALGRLAADPELRARLAQAARARSRRRDHLQEHLARLEDLYRRALA
jgi:glycosyltransferase involved in cell wall biosynthesis